MYSINFSIYPSLRSLWPKVSELFAETFRARNTWNGYTAENQEERLFPTRQHSYFGVTDCENSEVQIAVKIYRIIY